MRIGKRGFQARVKADLHIEYGDENLTSYADLELVRRFIRGLGLRKMLVDIERRLGVAGDVGLPGLVMVVLAMVLTGARRLSHISFLADDPLVRRFCGLVRLPTERTLSRLLKKLTYTSWPELDDMNRHVVAEGVTALNLPRWTLDMDGSVLTTGLSIERATRGYNRTTARTRATTRSRSCSPRLGTSSGTRTAPAASTTRIRAPDSCATT